LESLLNKNQNMAYIKERS